jgi:hypothetical protein
VDKAGLHRELLNEVKRIIHKLRKSHGYLEIMENYSLVRMINLANIYGITQEIMTRMDKKC